MVTPSVVRSTSISNSSTRLAENLQWLRSELKWSTRALAEHSRLSLSTLYAVEHPANATTRLRTVEKLANGLGVHPLVLLSSDRRIRQALSASSAIELVAMNLRTLRREKGLTQEALAANAQIARHLITKIETEVHANPTLELLDRLAHGLGASTEDLLRDGR